MNKRDKKIIENAIKTFERHDVAKSSINSSVNKFLKIYKEDPNGRYLSYDHIREAFLRYKDDISKRDLLALYLYSYLASWGMLRNSFLMQKDYKFLIPIIDILCSPKYKDLVSYNPFLDEGDSSPKLIMELVKELRSYFLDKTYFKEGEDKLTSIKRVSDTLISKIILGTLGCLVAYDTYVKKGLSKHNLTFSLGSKSIKEIREFAKSKKEAIEDILASLNNLYTPMKILDMYFFIEGRK